MINSCDFVCVYACLQKWDYKTSQLCAKMASESSREETLLLLRKTISRLDGLKANHSWRGDDSDIEDAFRDIQRQRYVISHKSHCLNILSNRFNPLNLCEMFNPACIDLHNACHQISISLVSTQVIKHQSRIRGSQGDLHGQIYDYSNTSFTPNSIICQFLI